MAMDTQKVANYAPINNLPPEILARIMWDVTSLGKETESRRADGRVLRYPEAVSYVCSHWRQVAIRSHNLWCCIDVPMSRPPGNRTMTFLDRAAEAPLKLCLFDDYRKEGGESSFELIPFLAPVTSRLKSLELVARSGVWSNIQTSALSACLAGCTGANLRTLTILDLNMHETMFIKARDQHIGTDVPANLVWIDIDLDKGRLEDILQGVTVLRLFKVYPQWTSRAYCRLTELRLVNTSVVMIITEDQLMGILRSSPGLRIFQLDLYMKDILRPDAIVASLIALPELEALSMGWMQRGYGIEALLRWFAPCPRLRQFSLRNEYYQRDLNIGHPSIAAFWAGSDITRIHIKNLRPKEISDLVSCCPRVRELAYQDSFRYTEKVLPVEFHTLYLIGCHFKVEILRRLLLSSSVQKLVVYHSKILQNQFLLLSSQLPATFSDVCSEVLVVPENDRNPIAHWGVSWGWDREFGF